MSEQKAKKTEKLVSMGHSQAESHARTQQEKYEKHVQDTSNVTNVISQFFKTNLLGFAWHYCKSRFGPRHAYQHYPAQGDTGIYPLQASMPSRDGVTVALLSDWASDTEESDHIGHLVAKELPDYTIHLGDVYFVGAPREIEANFTAPYASWYYGPSGSLVLSGNHEMYSNGNAFFQQLLPAMYACVGETKKTQQAGFFCLENDFWRIIGLDTGYTSVERPFLEIIKAPDCHLRHEQIAWLRDVVRIGDPSDHRGLILLSHHPNVSAFRDDYPVPGNQLRELLGDADRPVIWFWGHDHRLVVYKEARNSTGPLAYGRCIGHGGLPVEIEIPDHGEDSGKIEFYDRRVRRVIKGKPIGYNGFVTLHVEKTKLIARYRDLTNQIIFEEMWEVNMQNGQLSRKILQVVPELALTCSQSGRSEISDSADQ